MRSIQSRSFAKQALAWGFIALAFVTGCAKIAGIDDPPVDPNTSTDSSLCSTYCDTVMAACSDAAHVYASRGMCLGVCQDLQVAGKSGEPNDQSGDTIYCRLFYAKQAASTGETSTCPQAGPGGGGICGTNCEAYCILMQQTCPQEFESPDLFKDSLSYCITQCADIPEADAGFNADQQTGDTINCRLYHVSAAAANPDAPVMHCPHAAAIPNKTPCAN